MGIISNLTSTFRAAGRMLLNAPEPSAAAIDTKTPFTPRFESPHSLAVPPMLTPEEKALNMANIVPQMYQAWGAYGYLPSITWYQLANMYVSWTFTAINKKATTISSLPVQLYRYESKQTGKTIRPYAIKHALASCNSIFSGEEKTWKVLKQLNAKRIPIEEHPCIDLLNDPNPDMVRSTFWQLMIIHLCLNGAVGIYKAKKFLGNPLELQIIPTTWTGNLKPIPGQDGRTVIAGYKLIDLDIQEEFAIDDIIWPHFPSLRNPYEGMSPVKANLYAFDLDQYLLQQMTAFYKNSAMFSNVLGTDQILEQDVYNDLKTQAQAYQGAKNSGQMFVTHGGMKFLNTMQGTARDAMIVEVEKMCRERLLAGEDVSEGKLGLTSQQNRANLQVVNENYFNEAIRPLAIMLTEYFDKHLVSLYDDRLSFEFGYPSFEDRAANLAERKTNLSLGYSTINEERAKDGEEPVDWGNVPLIPSNLLPLGEKPVVAAPGKPPAKPQEGGQGGTEGGGEGAEGGEKPKPKNLRIRTFSRKASWTAERKAMAWKRFDRLAQGYERLFERAAKRHFKFVQALVIDNLEKHGIKIKANIGAMSRQHKLEYIAEHKDRLDAIVPDSITLKASIKELFKPVYEDTIMGAAQDRIEEFGMTLDFNINHENVKKWLGDKLENLSKNVSDTEIQMTKDILREDFANGEGIVTMSDHLRDAFAGNENRAHVIARTESTAAYNKGDVEAVRQLGVPAKKIWVAEPTARETHAQAGDDYSDGISLDDLFEVGDDTMDAPGNGDLPEENVNCFPGDVLCFSPGIEMLFKSKFNGKVITVQTASGNKLTGTPNHPVLTQRGFVPLRLLEKGDRVVRSDSHERMSVGNVDAKNRPSQFEEMYNSSFEVGSIVRIIRSRVNFHGDRPDSDVDVVCVNRELSDRIKAGLLEPDVNRILAEPHGRQSRLLSDGALTTSKGIIGGESECFSGFGIGLRHAKEHRLASIPGNYPSMMQSSANRASADSKLLGNRLNGIATIEKTSHLRGSNSASKFLSVKHQNAMLAERAINGLDWNAKLLRELSDFFSGAILFDEIVDIHESSFCGDVFTMQAHNGIYIAGNVNATFITKNCRCSLVYDTSGGSGDEEGDE